MINILPILFSLYLFGATCDMFVKYLNMKDVINVNRKKYLYLSIIAVIIDLLLIFNSGSSIFMYLKITGIYLVVVSILCFVDYFNYKITRN